jgi:cell wall-associated NlpC family hydrolase
LSLRPLISVCAFVFAAAVLLALAPPALAVVDDGARAVRTPMHGYRGDPPTKGEKAVGFAVRAVGVPYRWGGESPASGFDCSGLVRWAYARVGVDLPHSSYALYGAGRRIATSQLEPGDVLFFDGLGHVGLYVGDGKMVHAPHTGLDVEVVSLGATSYGARLVGARRIVAS